MRMDSFTTKAREAIEAAVQDATARGNPQVEPEHLLVAVLGQKDGVVASVLKLMEKAPEALSGRLEAVIDGFPRATGAQVGAGRGLQELLAAAGTEAAGFKDDFISTEHLFLAALSTREGEV
ncbi:MAG TPA: Clp protease N-terminal domain-containing protein, partial [Myxococcota bacterium]|nr:Clp protease N-terminal domain-containing protein [Myxococcota bacterium]